MNQIKRKFTLNLEKPVRKNSDDFDDYDLEKDSDSSNDEDIINKNYIKIDNGKPNNEINLLKKGLLPKNEEETNKISNENNKYFYFSSDEGDNKNEEDSEQEDKKIEENKSKKKNGFQSDSKSNKESKKNNENNIVNKDIDINDKDNDEQNKNIILKEDSKEMDEDEQKEKIENALINSIMNKEKITRERIQLADDIDFRNEPEQIIFTDEYGFIQKTPNNKKIKSKNVKVENREKKKKSLTAKVLLQVNARLEKWNYMIQNYQEFSTNKKNILKARTRKGIPDSLRGYVWQLFADKEKYYVKGLYQSLEKEPVNEDLEIVILKDLDRTFPLCQFFREKYGNGQRKLYKVLSAYSKYNKNVGYVQGMGFITGIFLIYMDEESSFYMMHCLMKKYNLEGLYYDGFPDLKKKCYVFLNLQKRYINNIFNRFKEEGIMPTMYLTAWFISLYARTFEFETVLRIYDCFFLEGFKVIYRIALSILKLNENVFLKVKKGEVLPLIYTCTDNLEVEELFKVAFDFNMSRNYIDKLEKEYEKVKNDKENEMMKQLAW